MERGASKTESAHNAVFPRRHSEKPEYETGRIMLVPLHKLAGPQNKTKIDGFSFSHC